MQEAASVLDRFLVSLDADASRVPAAARGWRIAVAALLAGRHLEHPVDLIRVLEMALVQALPGSPEALRSALDPDNGLHVFALLLELQTAGTSEARLVRALAESLDGRPVRTSDRFLRALTAAAAPPRRAG